MSEIRLSRPVAAAAALGEHVRDPQGFPEKRVLLLGEAPALATPNGQHCLLSSLRLLVRGCRSVAVSVPPGDLRDQAAALADEQTIIGHAEILKGEADVRAYDAVLSVGSRARPELPWTAINSQGWLARVTSGPTPLPEACDRANPIGALGAASLGAAEVFKRLVGVRESRGRVVDGLSFSLNTYRSDDLDPGPEIPGVLPVHLLLVGAGAIGNGIIYLLHALPLSGEIAIVDGQAYGEENLGTCFLISPAHVGKPKASFAEAILCREGLKAKGFPEDLTAFARRLGEEVRHPRIVLNALDNIEARHGVQALWPDLVIDGAISDFGCQVSRHPWGEDVACLRCLFRAPAGANAERAASSATGLEVSRVLQPHDLVRDEDVERAPGDKREWLRSQVGRPVCSVVSEAMARAITNNAMPEGFRPSVPFVATLSASMVVGELVKAVAGWKSVLEPRFQLDVLQGPCRGEHLPQARSQSCVCVTRSGNIETLRRGRSAA